MPIENRRIELKVTFYATITLNENAYLSAEEFERENGFSLEDNETLDDIDSQTREEIIFNWFTQEYGLGAYHMDYSGKKPIISLGNEAEYEMEKVYFEDPEVELVLSEEG